MWTRRLIGLALLAGTLSGCVTYRYSSGEAACLEVIRGDDPLSRAELRWLRFWQSTPYCQAVRARWASLNRPFVPPTVMMLLSVRPLQCIRNGSVVQITARFMNPANSGMVIDPFDAVVGSDPVLPPGSTNAGTMTPIDLQGNPPARPSTSHLISPAPGARRCNRACSGSRP